MTSQPFMHFCKIETPNLPVMPSGCLRCCPGGTVGIDEQMRAISRDLLARQETDPMARRLARIPGTGPIEATCLPLS